MVVTPHWPSYQGTARRGLGADVLTQILQSQQGQSSLQLPPVPTADDLAQAAQLTANARLTQATGGLLTSQTLLYASGFTPADVTSMANSLYQNALQAGATDAANAWAAATSPAANSQRIDAGASAGLSLIINGYNPGSNSDNQQLIVAIAGACSLIPGIGTMLGGAVMILDAIGEAAASLLEAVGLVWFGCRTSGDWTPAMIAAQYPGLHLGPGTFAALANAAILKNAADFANCNGRMDNQVVLAAVAQLWNANSSGPPMTVYVPAMTAGGPQPFVFTEQAKYAFAKVSSLSQVPLGNYAVQTPEGSLGAPFNTTYGDPSALDAPDEAMNALGYSPTPPGILQLTGSIPGLAIGGSAPAAPAAVGPSTAANVAAGTAVVGGAALTGTAVYAFAKGQAVSTVLKSGLLAIKGWFIR